MTSKKIFHGNCSICSHPQRDDIEKMRYVDRRKLQEIVDSFSCPPAVAVSVASLSRHFSHIDEEINEGVDIILDGVIPSLADIKKQTVELALTARHDLLKGSKDIRLYAVWHQLVKLAYSDLAEAPQDVNEDFIRKLWIQQKNTLNEIESTPSLFDSPPPPSLSTSSLTQPSLSSETLSQEPTKHERIEVTPHVEEDKA